MHKIVKAGLLIGMAGLLATSAMAQSAVKQFPSGLKWETMGLVGFNYKGTGYEGTPADRTLAWSVWGPTIEAFPLNSHFGNNKWPAFVIVAAFENNKSRYVFTSMRAAAVAYPACEDAINSSDPNTPIYTNCPLRVIKQDKASGQTLQSDFSPFCNMSINHSDQPKSRNYEQIAMSADGKTAYFRVVQYGKPAPECNRAIKLP